MQQVKPLCRQLTDEKVDPCHVAARPGEAGDKTQPDRVLGGNKGDRDRRGCRLGHGRRGDRARCDYGDLSANQFGRQLRQSIVLVLGEAVDDCYVLAGCNRGSSPRPARSFLWLDGVRDPRVAQD